MVSWSRWSLLARGNIPTASGVYQLGVGGALGADITPFEPPGEVTVLYAGRARSLRRRLLSHGNKSHLGKSLTSFRTQHTRLFCRWWETEEYVQEELKLLREYDYPLNTKDNGKRHDDDALANLLGGLKL